MTGIRYVVGDATDPIGDGPKIVAHVVNDAGRWGAGFSGAVSRRWKEPEQRYRHAFRTSMADWGVFPGLESVFLVRVEEDLCVANMVAQHGVVGRGNPHPLDYFALRRCLEKLAADALLLKSSVHMPRIGCGLAGGTWDVVEPLITDALCERGIEVIVYDLPEQPRTAH